ncbi:unnamed protein product [Brassica oleracea]|uniref:Uncharacterized protein n=2 Tax=Brassica TaxID=3705 RepID=A0A3P6C991_BRAOL|nr:unnamed protein product [Brassica napus]VDD09694.1 unnamed protein product [Brassica oleracea]
MMVNSCEQYGGYQGYQDFGVEGYEQSFGYAILVLL